MNRSNYAFVSALYANQKRGLYTDIYFPIIKYALAKLFAEKQGGYVYCSAEDVTNFIEDKFGFKIPTIVIAKSVMKIGNHQAERLNLVVYEKGNTFQINRAVLDEDEMDLEDKERFFSERLDEIENKYKEFISQQGCVDDGVSFVQFIADNTDDVLGYFEQEKQSSVNERYASLVQFLQYIHEMDKDLYKVVHQLFWSSVVVAFLKSEKPLVDDSNDGIKAEYYLDTSIVLGLLDLSTSLRETYSKEVCTIILNSGGLLRVNPMTVEEIKRILEKVEQNGPNPLTDIADAYSRRKLITNHLTKIRLELDSILNAMQIEVFPKMSPAAVHGIVNNYTGKAITKLLKDFRSKSPSSYTNDNFREIHDVYMDDFIKQRRKEKGVDDGIHFLTDNIDLVRFCRAQHEGTSYMLSTGKVVLNLWMHSKQEIDVSDCVLTETMARCLGMHKSNVRCKILEVSRFYNQTKDDFNPDVYREFVRCLYRRAKNVIAATEQIAGGNDLPQSITSLIEDAVAKDNEVYNNSLAKSSKENQELRQEYDEKEKQLEDIKAAVSELQKKFDESNKQIGNLKSDKDALSANLQQHRENLKSKEEALAKSIQESETANRRISLYDEREQLRNAIRELEVKLMPLENERKRSFRNWSPKAWGCLGILFLFAGIVVIVTAFISCWDPLFLGVLAFLGTVGIYLLNRSHALNDKKEERAKDAYEKWESRNPRYAILTEKLSNATKRLNEINAELKK